MTPAERMALSRRRRRRGLRVIWLEVRDSEIEGLIRAGLLASAERDSRRAIARALGAMLDRQPAGWWGR
jgi:hypothetical protein